MNEWIDGWKKMINCGDYEDKNLRIKIIYTTHVYKEEVKRMFCKWLLPALFGSLCWL